MKKSEFGRLGLRPLQRLGLRPSQGAAAPWYDPDALMDADFGGGRFRHNGVTYPDKASFLTAIGATEASGIYAMGPYVDPAGANLLLNAAPPADTSSWAALNGSVALANGRLELTGGGATAATLTQLMNSQASRGIRIRGAVTRVTGGPGVFLAMAPGAASLAPSNYQVLQSGPLDTPQVIDICFGTGQATNYVGLKQNGVSTGKSALSTIEAKYGVPVAGMDYRAISLRARGTMPLAISGNKVLLQFGDDTERERIRLVWDGSGNLRLITTFTGVEQSNIDLGVVAPQAAFDVSFSVQANLVLAQLNGGVIQQDTAAGMPGVLRGWFGRSVTGETFDGGPMRVQIYGERMPRDAIWLAGDSGVAGSADLTSLWESIQTQTSTRAFQVGVGGTTLQNHRDVVQLHTGFAARNRLIHWDMYPNGYRTLGEDMADFAAIAAAKPDGKFLFLTPLTPPGGDSDINIAAAARRTAMLSTYGSRCYDAQTFVDGVADPYQADQVHLKRTTMNLMAPQVTVRLPA